MPVAGTRKTASASALPLAWERNSHLPRGVATVLAALRFSEPAPELLRRLSDTEWKAVLDYTDRGAVTLLLGAMCRDYAPAWVNERLGRNLAGNTERIGRLRAALVEIAARFDASNIDFLLLKGFSQEVEYTSDPYLRMGYDIDLYSPPHSLAAACEALRALDYRPIEGAGQLPADHVPPMIRKTGWEWRGDFFDPDIPGCIDLHFQFWDPATELFQAPGVEDFWAHRIRQDGLPVLGYADRLGYAALHLVRHLFRASVRPSHVYEIAYFLETQAGNEAFWEAWRELHPDSLRRLEAIAFRLAAAWFGCRSSPVAQEEMARLDRDILLWFESYSACPVEAQFHPSKHELWLHFALLDSTRDRRRVFMRRMFPARLPGPLEAVFVPEDQLTWHSRLRRKIRYYTHVGTRALHHARAWPPTIAHGLIWKSRMRRLPGPFWRYLLSSLLYYLGLYQFAVLYNLYLLDLGYRENVLGLITGAFTAGNLAGVLPAAAVLNRFGLKRSLLAAVTAAAAAFALRAALAGEPALLATAFAAGALNSIWVVAFSPVTAAVTPENARPTAFSLLFGSGITLGIGAGVIAGSLARWVARSGLAASPPQSKQLVLFAGSACVALALWPLLGLRIESPPPSQARSYPRGPFIRSFLLAMAVWSFATGLFAPLFNAYFSRRFSMPVDRIGMVFSVAQVAQAVAMFAAPLVLKRFGLSRGVAAMQVATALSLIILAPANVAIFASVMYAAYLSFQYMSEPGIYASLMNRVSPGQRSGASALNFLVFFSGQAIAASVAGACITRYGYPPLLTGAAILAAVAAWLFSRLQYDS